MDSNSVLASKNISAKLQKSYDDPDLISNLPDFVIGHILSFVSTKDAVRTSVLSKRWIYLWTLITELRFDDRECFSFRNERERKTRFLNFVNRVLLHVNIASIQSFSLTTASVLYDPYHIHQWISAVSNRGIKKISVHSWIIRDLFYDSLFQCQSLEELVLNICYCAITVPTFVCLSSLTVLKLSRIEFTSELEELTLNFPVLRKYETSQCKWPSVKSVTLQVPLLEVVSIFDDVFDTKSRTEIKFCASHLTELCYHGTALSGVILLGEAHIASASITVCDYNRASVQQTKIFVCKLLSINAECLKLCENTWQVLARVKHSFADMPVFGMLGHLELDIVTGDILMGMLLKSKCLKTLVLKVAHFDKGLLYSAIVPDCFLSTLKVVKFQRFVGDEDELNFAKFVMENAEVLEKICFSCDPGMKDWHECENKVKKKLLSCKRSFSPPIIEFLS